MLKTLVLESLSIMIKNGNLQMKFELCIYTQTQVGCPLKKGYGLT